MNGGFIPPQHHPLGAAKESVASVFQFAYSAPMSYEQRMDFIRNRMRMSHVYQPVMLVTLLPKMTEDLARGAE